MACVCSYPDYQRNRGIKLAGQFDLINGGMARKTMFVSSAYFRNPKALDNVAWIKAPQSRRGLLGEKKHPAWAHTEAGKREPKVGQVYIMQLGSSVMAITCNAFGTNYGA